MLAALGFIISGICFGIFAYTFKNLVADKTKRGLAPFSYAYYSLALALITWGVAAAIGGDELLKLSVLVGDGFLLLGTVIMLDIWLEKKNRVWIGLASVVAMILLYVRAAYFAPTPYMQDGILIFNTQEAVAIVLGAMFILVWLPVSIKVAKLVAHTIGQDGISSMYSAMFAAATVSSLVFLASKKTLTVALSFTALCVCFVMLIGSNMLIAKMTENHHGK